MTTAPAPDVKLVLPPLLHVGMVVLDLEAAAWNFERRWGTHITDVSDVAFEDALYYDRPATISVRSGLICSGASNLELTQPLSDSPFRDFLRERKGDGIHHLAYVVDEIDAYLDRLRPKGAELVLDARVPAHRSRIVLLDGFAHGPTIELIEVSSRGATHD